MRDDQELNIKFVQLVEAHPCLYDNTSKDYHRLNVQEKAWQAIAQQLHATAPECKLRWRNLRGRYVREQKKYLPSGSGYTRKRGYYLAEYMDFLLPFITSRKSKSNMQIEDESEEDSDSLQSELLNDSQLSGIDLTERDHRAANGDIQELPDEDHLIHVDEQLESHTESLLKEQEQNVEPTQQGEKMQSSGMVQPEQAQLEEQGNLEQQEQQNSKKKTDLKRPLINKTKNPNIPATKRQKETATIEDVNCSTQKYFEWKLQSKETPATQQDADALFLMSVIPDMHAMNPEQKRRFKVCILSLASEILSERLSSPSPVSQYSDQTQFGDLSRSAPTDVPITRPWNDPPEAGQAVDTFITFANL